MITGLSVWGVALLVMCGSATAAFADNVPVEPDNFPEGSDLPSWILDRLHDLTTGHRIRRTR